MKKRTSKYLALTLALPTLVASSPSWSADAPPVAPVRPVTDTYFGTPVVDDYRYMENLKSPEVQQFMRAQANYTNKVLDGIPGRTALAQRIGQLISNDLQRNHFQRRGERLFYLLLDPSATVPMLAYRDGVNGTEHILVDPGKLSKDSAHHFALDWYAPSWDGRYVAYGVSEGGSEKSVLHVLDVKTGQTLEEHIDRTSNGVVSWRKDNQSFFYLRYPKAGPDTPPALSEYNAVTYLHTVGQRADGEGDEAVFGRGVSASLDVPEGQGTYVLVSPNSAYAVAVANRNMDDTPNTFYVARLDQIDGARTPWKKIASPEDGVVDVQMHGDQLYFLTEKGASHLRIMATPLAHPDVTNASVIVPEGANVIDSFATGSDAIYVAERAGASFKLARVSYAGKDSRTIDLPFAGTISDLSVDAHEPGAMLQLQNWVKSPREIAYDPKAGTATDTGLVPPAKTETSDFEVRDVFATSYDGTRVPVSIIAKKGIKLDGSHPTIVFGYASYGLSMDPQYRPAWNAWIERGGVYVVSHMRGGGEFGDAWHRAGQKLTKMNTILDFEASAQYMIDQHYTQSKFLAANSASAGGIVMGGALTVNPELFRVVLDDVGESDTLRMETEPNGPPNVPEFGSASTEPGFHGLFAMSAYDHIHDGTPYPAVMFTTGANDPRVAPWHMLKMTARVQAATSSANPVLLRVDYDAGHGMGSSRSQYAARLADEWSFALWQMGEPGFQPKQQ
ncbi:MAG TPA: prolyl oligopeptidase family serine peptidase [Trinickia sp.]|jgi:prolyl oligopeptidase|uniref:prolyl oligopeptidase family serine peptidase n=1 Tax=Trinickia sp. TaxID=2571163 RepID=UPI002D1C14A3|nr:prolyl oligopeptidase family serine peptidase [Trinickia sp.]HTI18299.1 prolyl oligopeptidase family serine peptidase [Trinickia sp.]